MDKFKTLEEIIEKFNQKNFPVCLIFIEDGQPVARKLDGYRIDLKLLKEMVGLMDEE